MAVENNPIDIDIGNRIGGQPGAATDSEDLRRKALLRLAVAGVVTTLALAGLWWLDQGSKKPEKPVPAALPSPIVAAPLQESAPPQPASDDTLDAEEPPTPEQAETAHTGTPHPMTAAGSPESPPPPKVSNAPRVLGAPASSPRATPRSAPAQFPAAQTAMQTEQFVVQLAVFSKPERARELVNKLNKQGIRARMETRVHLGPFASHAEAERAQMEMRKLGLPALVTPAYATK